MKNGKGGEGGSNFGLGKAQQAWKPDRLAGHTWNERTQKIYKIK